MPIQVWYGLRVVGTEVLLGFTTSVDQYSSHDGDVVYELEHPQHSDNMWLVNSEEKARTVAENIPTFCAGYECPMRSDYTHKQLEVVPVTINFEVS